MDVCLFKYYFKNSPLVLYSSKVEMLSHVTHCFLCLQKHEQVKNVTYKFPVLFSTDTYSLYSVSVFQKTPEHVVGFFELNGLLHEFGVSKVFFLSFVPYSSLTFFFIEQIKVSDQNNAVMYCEVMSLLRWFI